jgi:hypothetical protein
MSHKGIRCAAVVLGASTCVAAPGGAARVAAAGKEPRLTVKASLLSAALTCHGSVKSGAKSPIIFAPGTGSDGSQVYALGKGAFQAIGRPVCVVSFPNHSTADLQISVQYLVAAIRTISRRARRAIAVVGVSQGGLLARVALTYWPSLRDRVTDVVSVAGTQHGTTVVAGILCEVRGCPPAIWQQAAGSHFLKALNDGRPETFGPTSWTTVRSATDELVEPETGPSPTSSLRGAANVLIQAVCPGRRTSHLGTAVDSVTIAAIADAVTHRGPAKVSRFPRNICAHPYGTGLDPKLTALFLQLAQQRFSQALTGVPLVRREPRVQPWLKRGS